ncbi:hypothetical protein [Chenggangzhangella methanolivorans]|uniref:Uncharacterized protein n=1 Tax=Chenggangzhangella methanolivorans TaxID=1437009 RepID=A0A9E6UMA4_9HYPH|nr:hypothetical protein [Chenggangzhangella methanolivorans]QZN98983.1 hypothetical protein K6K41_19160 [Chenggangzhangella methanolivorans]
MVFSPQQVKFEFLSYFKEFGGNAEEWRIGCAVDAKSALTDEHKIDLDRDIWLWKPTLSPSAARIVHRYFTQQLRVPDAGAVAGGANIYLFKRCAAHTA